MCMCGLNNKTMTKWSVLVSLAIILHSVQANSICGTKWQDDYCSWNITTATTSEQDSQYKCDKNIKLFFCQFMNYLCKAMQNKLPPCMETCLRVKHTCQSRDQQHQQELSLISLSHIISCDQLPKRRSGNCRSKQNRYRAVGSSTTTAPVTTVRQKPLVSAPQCRCQRSSKHGVGRKVYLRKGFSYALKAVHLRTDDQIPSGPAVIDIYIIQVLKKNGVNVEKGNQTLWVERGCVCPQMQPNKTYLFLGYEDRYNQRLLYNEDCIAVPWKKKWPQYIKKWEAIMAKQHYQPRDNREDSPRRRSKKKQRKSRPKNANKQ